MPLSAEAQAFLASFPQRDTPITPMELREILKTMVGPTFPDVLKVQDFTIPGTASDIPVRLYAPIKSSEALPVVVFFHGGAFIAGSIDSHDSMVQELAARIGYIFVSVNYRLAPEAKFPAGLEDCYAATAWVHANAASINADPSKIVLMGDSAGGNLVAATALMSRDKATPPIAFQVLIYPCIAHSSAYDSYESMKTNGEGYGLTRAAMENCLALYLAEPISQFADNPYVTPIKATNLKGLAPAFVLTAEYDVLRDEGEAYAADLKANGVSVQMSRFDGVIHGAAAFPFKEREAFHSRIHDVLTNFFKERTVLP